MNTRDIHRVALLAYGNGNAEHLAAWLLISRLLEDVYAERMCRALLGRLLRDQI